DDHATRRELRRHGVAGKRPREPAFLQVLIAARRGVPDFDRAEMRKVRRRIADALDDGELASLPKRHERLERGMKTRALVELQHVVATNTDPRPQAVVRVVGVRHHRVQPVVAALELDQHQEPSIGRALRERRTGNEHRGDAGGEEVAAVHLSWYTGSATSARTKSIPLPDGSPAGAAASTTSGIIFSRPS